MTGGLTFKELDEKYNSMEFNPVDGEMICCADKLAAFIEAVESIRNGITTKHLQEGVERLWNEYKDRQVGPVHIGNVFESFLKKLPH